jgi:hypothetical protein
MMLMPFTWPQFEREIGQELPAEAKRRLTRAVRYPSRNSWVAARSIVVAPQMSITGQTLWQCVQAMALSEFPDERTPDARQIVRGLCFAAGLPLPVSPRR